MNLKAKGVWKVPRQDSPEAGRAVAATVSVPPPVKGVSAVTRNQHVVRMMNTPPRPSLQRQNGFSKGHPLPRAPLQKRMQR